MLSKCVHLYRFSNLHLTLNCIFYKIRVMDELLLKFFVLTSCKQCFDLQMCDYCYSLNFGLGFSLIINGIWIIKSLLSFNYVVMLFYMLFFLPPLTYSDKDFSNFSIIYTTLKRKIYCRLFSRKFIKYICKYKPGMNSVSYVY